MIANDFIAHSFTEKNLLMEEQNFQKPLLFNMSDFSHCKNFFLAQPLF